MRNLLHLPLKEIRARVGICSSFLLLAFVAWWCLHSHTISPEKHATTGEILCHKDYLDSKKVLDAIDVAPRQASPKILCYILTVSKYHDTRVRSVRSTWGRQCSKLVFASDQTNAELDTIEIPNARHDYLYLWDKHRKTLKYLYDRYGQEYDWFLKADDDTYVIMDNLRAYLSSPEIQQLSNLPLQLGHRLVMPEYQYKEVHVPKPLLQKFLSQGNRWIYVSGGAGYAMNRAYLAKFTQIYHDPTCLPNEVDGQAPEDGALAFCMANHGIFPMSTRDAQDLERFHLHAPAQVYAGSPAWMKRYQVGLGGPLARDLSFSKSSISFHYVTGDLMQYLHAQLNECR